MVALVALVVALVAGSTTAAPLFTVRDGVLAAQVTEVRLIDLKSELESAGDVEIRIANDAIAQHRVTARVTQESVAKGLDRLLRDFNFVRFADPRSGRMVYLVTSLADSHAGDTPAHSESAFAPGVHAATASDPAISAPDVRPSTAERLAGAWGNTPTRSLDQVRPITPPSFQAYADQKLVDSEMARVREETLARAHAVLGDPLNGVELQRQALNELAGLGDPRSMPTLRHLINDSRTLDTPQAAEAVAQAAWRYAAQQQFANAEANRLLQTMADSRQPQVRAVGEAALRDSENFLAKNRSQ